MKILIAEDEPLTLLALEQHLKSIGYDVITANDGRDALNKIQAFSPQLIITDIMMPFTSGLELIGIIRSSYRQEIPIIVLSAIDEEDTVMEAFMLGANDFITKPFDPQELSLRVKRLSDMHQLTEA